MKNQGKVFEDNFRKSLNLNDPNLFFYRYKDGTASWGGGQQNKFVRFQAKNIADSMIFYKENLFIFELKNHKRKIFTFIMYKRKSISRDVCSKF